MLAPNPSMEFESEILLTGNPDSGQKQRALGALFCAVFVALSFSLRAQTAETRVVAKADRPMRTAGGGPELAN